MEIDKSLSPADLNRPDWNSLKQNYSKHDIAETYFIDQMQSVGLQAEQWGIDKREEDTDLIFDDKMDIRLWEPLDLQDAAPTTVPNDFRDTEYVQPTVNDSHKQFRLCAKDDEIEMDSIEEYGIERWQLRNVVDVKSKANPDWLGILNVRHLAHYAHHETTFGVPTAIYFSMVDMDNESVGEQDFVTPVPTDWNYERVAAHFDGERLSYIDLCDMVRTSDSIERVFRAPDGNPVAKIADSAQYSLDAVCSDNGIRFK